MKKMKLNPNFVIGFSDAEACFHVSILRNTKFKIPSNQIIQWRAYISYIITSKPLKTNESILNPWLITGFTDGEGCFNISIFRDNRLKTRSCSTYLSNWFTSKRFSFLRAN